MKKLLIYLVALATTFSFASEAMAQNNQNVFHKGTAALNAGLHMGNLHGEGMLGLGASLEFGILDNLIKDRGAVGVGLMVGYGSAQHEERENGTGGLAVSEWDYDLLRIATRGTFHYQFVPKLDTYAGITMGLFDIDKQEYSLEIAGKDIHDSEWEETTRRFCYGGFVGARYMPTQNLGVFAEFSADNFSFFALGVTLLF